MRRPCASRRAERGPAGLLVGEGLALAGSGGYTCRNLRVSDPDCAPDKIGILQILHTRRGVQAPVAEPMLHAGEFVEYDSEAAAARAAGDAQSARGTLRAS